MKTNNSAKVAIIAGLILTLKLSASDHKVRLSDEVRTSPSLRALVGLQGKTIASTEFMDVKRQCGLQLFSRKEELEYLFQPPGSTRFPVNTTTTYGGGGLLIVARSRVYVEGDLDGNLKRADPVIWKIQLIVGKCAEQDRFGPWKGETPKLELPPDPESLIAKYRSAYTDLLDISSAMGGRNEIKRTRRMYYNDAFDRENNLPYGFVFEDNKLALLELLAPRSPGRIIPLQPP